MGSACCYPETLPLAGSRLRRKQLLAPQGDAFSSRDRLSFITPPCCSSAPEPRGDIQAGKKMGGAQEQGRRCSSWASRASPSASARGSSSRSWAPGSTTASASRTTTAGRSSPLSNILIGFSALAGPRLAERFGQLRAILLVTGSSMLFMLSMAFVPIFSLAAGVYIVRSALMNMSGPLMDSFSMSIFPAEQRGLVSALSNIMFRLPNSFGTYLGGFILGMGLLQLPFYIASASLLHRAHWVLRVLRQDGRRRS